ncbi:MAG TPA: hypothetical protein VHZ07_04965 [Bryobacteraceae bacterium]|jgi:hypothetical protein|nr:hypothetical protein [Bryobacteraceae bacterium]
MRLLSLFLTFAFTLPAANYYLIVAGLGGAPEYEKQFEQWASETERALQAGGPNVHVETLSGAKATRQQLSETLTKMASDVQPDDTFGLLMIGHGTFDGDNYKFNLPGPDITAGELATLLDRIPAKRQLVVNMTSASGASLPLLARKGRVVITATKSGNEKNLTVFPRYFLDALRDPEADTDKSGSLSALEAFRYTQRKTVNYFESEKLLATEHAMLDDTGSKDGARDPSATNGEGLAASAFPLIPPSTGPTVAASPEKQKLLARKEDLEAKIDRLKYQKAAMPEEEYKREMAQLLLDLARTQAEIDR